MAKERALKTKHDLIQTKLIKLDDVKARLEISRKRGNKILADPLIHESIAETLEKACAERLAKIPEEEETDQSGMGNDENESAQSQFGLDEIEPGSRVNKNHLLEYLTQLRRRAKNIEEEKDVEDKDNDLLRLHFTEETTKVFNEHVDKLVERAKQEERPKRKIKVTLLDDFKSDLQAIENQPSDSHYYCLQFGLNEDEDSDWETLDYQEQLREKSRETRRKLKELRIKNNEAEKRREELKKIREREGIDEEEFRILQIKMEKDRLKNPPKKDEEQTKVISGGSSYTKQREYIRQPEPDDISICKLVPRPTGINLDTEAKILKTLTVNYIRLSTGIMDNDMVNKVKYARKLVEKGSLVVIVIISDVMGKMMNRESYEKKLEILMAGIEDVAKKVHPPTYRPGKQLLQMVVSKDAELLKKEAERQARLGPKSQPGQLATPTKQKKTKKRIVI